jgi:cytochrome c oxidase subunit III
METFIQNSRNKIHPWKFALWLGCGSILMMFAGWTSAFVIRHAAGNWLEYRLPNMFFYNTAVIISSSLTLQYAFNSFKKGNEKTYKAALIITFLLGLLFVVLQYIGWQNLRDIGVPLTKNPSGDFIYVLTGFHVAHVIGGIGALTIALVHAFSLQFKPTAKRRLRFELTTTYWHFVDLLWVYLLVFFITQS